MYQIKFIKFTYLVRLELSLLAHCLAQLVVSVLRPRVKGGCRQIVVVRVRAILSHTKEKDA
jgi:hypothetical protein